MNKIKKRKLDNGLSLVSVPVSGKSTTVLVLVGAGSMNEEPQNNGISHFLEHMCFKGTDKQTGKEIMRFLDGLGAETNAFTSFEYTGYYIKAIHKHWKKTLKVVSDIYHHSVFPEHEIETEKGVVLGEIAMYQDQPTSVVADAFRDLAYPDQMAGKTILGPAKNIKKMARKDFLEYHKKHYIPENTTVIVAGDVDHKKVFEEVKKYFAHSDPQKKHKRQKATMIKGARANIIYKKTEQTHIRIGYHAFSNKHKDIYALKLLSVILGGGMSSRLFERIREDLGMGYYVGASVNAHQDVGFLGIAAGIESKRLLEYISEIKNQLLSLRSHEVTQKELDKARDYLLGNAEMGLEVSDDIAYFLGKQDLFGDIETFSQIKKKYKAISIKDIKRVARKVFKDENLFCAILGPHQQKDTPKYLKELSLDKQKKEA